jgi:hypothetical protein
MPIQDESLVLVVDRYGGETHGNHGFISGNAAAALTGAPANASFVIPAKFLGMFLEVLEGGYCEDHMLVRRYSLSS